MQANHRQRDEADQGCKDQCLGGSARHFEFLHGQPEDRKAGRRRRKAGPAIGQDVDEIEQLEGEDQLDQEDRGQRGGNQRRVM